ncbi:helix-turn-helix domain-containing protein [Streptomyces sp. NPDC096198]|uniref:helix-turn-helix domain-containing protein n=1 Tax=Streptomyces sp. NPDC096198 TaxID=3366080 RepID=UPI003824805B
MSYEAREWVWDHSSSKGTARMVLALIADRCRDRRCIAYASLPTLMKRANASRTAVRDALAKLVVSGELVQLADRRGPRGETYYHLPITASFLTDQAAEEDRIPTPQGDRIPTPGVPESDPSGAFEEGLDNGPGDRIPTLGGTGFRLPEGTDSDPQNGSEPKVNGKSSSSASLITVAEWEIDDGTQVWLRDHGHLARLGEHGLRMADEKWRSYRATWTPRSAAAWGADWRIWIAREHTPAPERTAPRALSGGAAPFAGGMTRAEAHTAALLAALDEPTETE